MTANDESERKVGKLGNVYEDNPRATRHPRAAERVRRQRRAGGPDAAALALEKAGAAQRALDPGGEAAPDHGAPAGAANAMKFHTWGRGAGASESDPE